MRIAASGVTLDCDGGIIDGGGVRNYGILVAEPTGNYTFSDPDDPQGEPMTCKDAAPPMTGIRIQNCLIRNQLSEGIALRRRFREVPNKGGTECTLTYADSKYGSIHEVYRRFGLDAASAAQTRPQSDDEVTEAIRDLSVGDVEIFGVTIENVDGVGLYIWEFSHDYDVSDLEVIGASTGVYIDAASRDNLIESSIFEDNAKTGIIIDSAEANTVRTSLFAGHHDDGPAAGIKLFRNCGERMIPRMGHSRHNLLTENEFVDNDVGIWVGSRQGLPRNAGAPYDCSFDPEAEDGEVTDDGKWSAWVDANWNEVTLDAEQCVQPRMLGNDKIELARDDYNVREGTRQKISWFWDYAYANDIIDNTFYENTQAGVVVWDDDTSVLNNRFGGLQRHDTWLDICVGNQFREVIGEPVGGVIVEGNVSHGERVFLYPLAVAVHEAEMSQSANVDATMTSFMVLD